MIFTFFFSFIASVTGFQHVHFSFSHAKVGEPVQINLKFTMDWDMTPHEMLTLTMPRFTDGSSLGTIESTTRNFDLQFEPSTIFSGAWLEGVWSNNSSPYNSSRFIFIKKSYFPILAGDTIDLKIYAENGIRAYCGFPAHDAKYDILSSNPMESFQLFSNATGLTSPKYILPHPQMGLGCRLHNDCHERGICDYCKETCSCNPGWGADTDIVMKGDALSKYCYHRVCPAGKAIVDLPSSSTRAHELAECSNMGICDRLTGECKCFPPYTGSACDRLGCFNDCSGHGKCLSMRQISQISEGLPLQPANYEYGYDTDGVAWDADIMHTCVCDSSWSVGLGAGETQLPEYFGPDCSQRRCPSGDNPHTGEDETDCENHRQHLYGGYGEAGNLCHIDCSGRGICDYSTGKCSCFEGSTGANCGDLPSPYRRD